MRMVIISLMIFLILIGVWIWFHFTKIEPNTQYYLDSLADLSDKIEFNDWYGAKNDMEIHIEKWEDVRKYWIYFSTQDDIDNIDSSMNKLKSYVKNEDKIKAQSEIEHLKVLFNVIKENECLSMDNIF